MLPHDILTLSQRRRDGHAVFIGRHRTRKTVPKLIVVINIELNAGNRVLIQCIRFYKLKIAGHRLVGNADGIGLSVFAGVDLHAELLVHIIRRNACFFHAIAAVWQPACFRHAVCIRGDGDLFAHACSVQRGRAAQAGHGERSPRQGRTGQLIRFDDLDFALHLLISKGDADGLPAGDVHLLYIDGRKQKALRRRPFPNGIGSRLHIGECGFAVCAGCHRLQDRAAADQVKGCSCQHRAAVRILFENRYSAKRNIKGNGRRFERIRQTCLRHKHLLNGFVRHAYEERGLFILGRHGLRYDGQRIGGGRYADGVAAVEIIVRTVLPCGIAHQRTVGTADADEVGVGGQRDRADGHAAGQCGAFPRYIDVAGHSCAGNAVLRKPSGILQIHAGGMPAAGVKLVHLPVIAHMLGAFKLLDDLADGKLPCHAAPCIVVRVAAVQHHEGIGVAQHPGNGVHGFRAVHNAGITGRIQVGVDVHQPIRSFGLIPAARNAFAGAWEVMLDAVHRDAVQIVRGGVDFAVTGKGGNLQILAVSAGIAVQTGLPRPKAAGIGVERSQAESIHSGGGTQAKRAGAGQGKVRDRTFLCIRGRSFIGKHIGCAVLRPFHRTVRVIVAIDVADLIPTAALAVLLDGVHLYDGVADEHAQIRIFLCFIHSGEHAGVRRDGNKVAKLNVGLLIRESVIRHRIGRFLFRNVGCRRLVQRIRFLFGNLRIGRGVGNLRRRL